MENIIIPVAVFSIVATYILYKRYEYRKISNEAEAKVISEGFNNYYNKLSNEDLISACKDLYIEYRRLSLEQKNNKKINNEKKIAEIVCKMDFALPVLEERGLEDPEIED